MLEDLDPLGKPSSFLNNNQLEMCAALPLYGKWLAMRRTCVYMFLFFSFYGVHFKCIDFVCLHA